MKGYIPQTTGKYKKDYRRCEKRGWDMKLLDDVVEKLCRGEPLEESNYEHTLHIVGRLGRLLGVPHQGRLGSGTSVFRELFNSQENRLS